ncbi:mucin-5AC-like isoform X2 [Thalassophryne amazonica]|uniref:mucin-5AC-like isoform X2 n=1 Tax=Thalassophryne amazonica TaxID=390379 RepID=UPI001471B0A0|nr:mucin-5AC-like isoform X2 [Thalassophryne amazonica]
MSVSQTAETFVVNEMKGSNMRLRLNSTGDHNGNAFPISSSSSSCSSSCLEESSPDSLRTLSGLSGDRTDSPLDYDVFEVTLMTSAINKMDKITVLTSYDAVEEEGRQEDIHDVSGGMMQTISELSESNENSVYLDANSSEHHTHTSKDNGNLTMALSLIANSSCAGDCDLSSGSRHGSSTPNSDATEIPAEDDDETLFLSVSSDMDVSSTAAHCSESLMNLSGSESVPDERSTYTFGSLQTACALYQQAESQQLGGLTNPCTFQTMTESLSFEDLSEIAQMSSSAAVPTNPVPDVKDCKLLVCEGIERCKAGSKRPHSNTSLQSRAAKTKPPTTPRMSTSTAGKPASLEVKRVTRLDLKNVKSKVASRPTSSTPQIPNQNKSAASGRTAGCGKEEAQTSSEIKKQKSYAERKKTPTVRRTLSASTSSLEPEVVEEGHLDDSRNAVKEVPETCAERPPAEVKLSRGDAVIVSVGDHMDVTKVSISGEALTLETTVVKSRSLSTRVSSKLGPSGRHPGKSSRVDKGALGVSCASGPPQPPGSGTGAPGQGSPGPKQSQSNVSALGRDGQSFGAGSPTTLRQSQSQGIPKPRTAAEQLTGLAAPSSGTPISKPSASQQPTLGTAGRPAAPTVSKLPVKGLPTNPSSSSVGSGPTDNNGTPTKASPTAPGTTASVGLKSDDRPSRSTLPVGSQNTAKHLNSNNNVTGEATNVIAAPKGPTMRSRALSLQARTTAAGLKSLATTNHSTTKTATTNHMTPKTAATNQGLTKQASHYPLQRSGSARFSRPNTVWAQQLCVSAWQPPVDKNKPRDVMARTTNCNVQVPASPTGNNQHQAAADLVPDHVNCNASTPAFQNADTTNAVPGTTGSAGFKARTGLRSSPKTASRLQNISKLSSAGNAGVSQSAADGKVQARMNQNKEQLEKKNQAISHLRKLLVQGNRRVEALATVIQHIFIEREETLKQKKALSLELANLREELVRSSQCCELLQKEKEEVCIGLEAALKKVEQQHKEELVQLEDRLQSFYQTEWDKVHQTYQEEADKCRMLMEQQVEELRTRQRAERTNQEEIHKQKMESLKAQYETSLKELKMTQRLDLENFEQTAKDMETSLCEKISELKAENEELNEKLKMEEKQRKMILSDKNLKDSHTLYLEQELESLKVVLEIKNNQLHQKEKKLMEMDKLVETNVKLEECLKKVQQENEDYKARMDKHAALSKQLSTEQAILQQTLQKESKVNKRLSMENEELLWKLHNGDLLASPRRPSPTSPFGSPQNSASFSTTAPLSPR